MRICANVSGIRTGRTRRVATLVGAAALAVAALASQSALAQTSALTPTAEQLEAFRSLSADEQQALMQQFSGALGGQGGSLGTLNVPGPGVSRSGQIGREQEDLNQPNLLLNNPNAEPPEPAIPVLKPEDWIVVEVDFHLGPKGSAAAGSVKSDTTGAAGTQAQQASPPATQMQPGTESERTEEEQARLKKLIDVIRSRNPYQLSREGVLNLPGFAGIPLAGLIDDLATLRLKVEPSLSGLDLRVTRLPLKKTGAAGLKPFGYDLFLKAPSTFAPVTNVPVPADYVLGPGDRLEVQLYGNQNRTLKLQVGRDGRLSFPEVGPIIVGSLRFNEAKSLIEARVAREMMGVRASVTMGETRSILVFVLGDATRPGSYTISGLGTITSALYAAGGVRPIGSLRKIELKRQGTLVRRLDLYDLLIRGDTTDDAKLLPGDVIFIPPVGATVSVDGEVHRPAIYEQTSTSTVADVLRLAGGLTPEADSSRVVLTRIDANRGRIVVPVDLAGGADRTQVVHDGDLLRVARVRPTLDSGVLVKGYVFAPGAFAYRNGMRLSNVIGSVDELQPNADIHYLLIRRELPPDRRIDVLSADLSSALQAPGSAADVPLMPRDQITVFDLQTGRDRIIHPILEELRLQSNLARPTHVVRVDGRVKVPGEYPLEPGMRVSDLIRAGGSLQDAAYAGSAELIRYVTVGGERRNTELVNINLEGVLRGDPRADILLEPFDLLNIKELPQWGMQESIELSGEIRFPGRYVLKRGETLKSVIIRAGGLTEYAFPYGAVFTREELRKREQEQIDELAERLKHDLAILALQSVAVSQGQGGGAALTVGQALLSQLKATRAVGRLVIDLSRTLDAKGGSSADVILRGGDRLIVPKFQQEITVLGEVQDSTSHLYRAGMTRDDYIALSGGATRRADTDRIYIVHANGSVVANEGSRWFERSDTAVRPGDTVVVPLNAEHLPPLPFWQAVTSILYNVAIAAAAVHSF